MREKRFLVIKIVDGGVRPLNLTFSEVKEILEMSPNDEVYEFMKTSEDGEYLEFATGFIIKIRD